MLHTLRRHLSAPPDPRQVLCVVGTALALCLGAWPRSVGGPDPVALLAWGGLFALPAGLVCGAVGARMFPLGLVPPGVFSIALVQVMLASERAVAGAFPALAVVTGLYLTGLGLGSRWTPAPTRTALRIGGVAFAVLCAAAWLPIATGITTGEAGFAASSSEMQARLIELSPLALVFDAVGWDWMRGNALTYRWAGAEWVSRAPWNATLAATVAVVVGCLAAAVLPALRPRGAGDDDTPATL